MTLIPIRHITDDALDHIPELHNKKMCEQHYFSHQRVQQELKPLIDIIQSHRDELMLVASHRNTPVFYDHKDASSRFLSPRIEKQFLRMMIGRVQDVAPAGRHLHADMESHARFTSGGYWQKRAGGMLLDAESLLQTYAVPQHNIHGGEITPEGLVSYRFSFGQNVNWIFQLPQHAFWGLLSQQGTYFYEAREDRFRIVHELLTQTLDQEKEVAERKAQDPFF